MATEHIIESNVLYKYGKFDEYTENFFTHNEIYFSSPNGFNDPFDSKLHLTHDGTMKECKRYLCEQLQRKYPERSEEEILTAVEMEFTTKRKNDD